MKNIYVTFVLLLCGALCNAQTLKGTTFQGVIGDSPLFLHIEAVDGVVTGFCKYESQEGVIPPSGTINNNGNNITISPSDKGFLLEQDNKRGLITISIKGQGVVLNCNLPELELYFNRDKMLTTRTKDGLRGSIFIL